jgi:hypothetical protein
MVNENTAVSPAQATEEQIGALLQMLQQRQMQPAPTPATAPAPQQAQAPAQAPQQPQQQYPFFSLIAKSDGEKQALVSVARHLGDAQFLAALGEKEPQGVVAKASFVLDRGITVRGALEAAGAALIMGYAYNHWVAPKWDLPKIQVFGRSEEAEGRRRR